MNPNNEHEHAGDFRLHTSDVDFPPVLTGVDVDARLDGVLWRVTLTQSYRHGGPSPLELLYTFPLPPQAVLLGFAAQFGAHRVEGRVMARAQARQTYEQAREEGDEPVLLEAGPDGLYTARIGRLQPQEEVKLEIRFAQFLAFEQGRLRLSLPTTLAPRYGNAADAGLAPEVVPAVARHADHPLRLAVTLTGAMARAAVHCPTHAMRATAEDDGLRLELDPSARLDRDVVLWVTPAGGHSDVLAVGRDPGAEGATVTLAAFPLQPPPGERARIALKLLVDCSGSMLGDSIASARQALQGVVAELRRDDLISLMRFGHEHELVLPPQKATARTLARLRQAIEQTEASMGGTEMEAALQALFELPTPHPSDGVPADVLVITDGEIWNADPMIERARRSGHRVFVIGVGASPAQGVLQRLAASTGGHCEFATPGEALQAAAARMLVRIKQFGWARLEIDWGQPDGVTPRWSYPVPLQGFGGDTVLAMAGWDGKPSAERPVRLVGLQPPGQRTELARADWPAPSPGDELARMAAALRMQACHARRDDALAAALAQQLALQYQLIGPDTACVLVHRPGASEERASEDDQDRQGDEGFQRAPRATSPEPVVTVRVPSMLAAGWGGSGTVAGTSSGAPVAMGLSDARAGRPSLHRTPRRRGTASSRSVPPGTAESRPVATPGRTPAAEPPAIDGELPLPDFLRDLDDDCTAADEPAITLAQLADVVAAHLALGGTVSGLASCCREHAHDVAVQDAIAALQAQLGDEGLAWLLLALWVSQRPGEDGNASVAAWLAEPVARARLSNEQHQHCRALLDQHLGSFGSDTFPPSQARQPASAPPAS